EPQPHRSPLPLSRPRLLGLTAERPFGDAMLLLLRLLAIDDGRDGGGDVLPRPICPRSVVEGAPPLSEQIAEVHELVCVLRTDAAPLRDDDPIALPCPRQPHQPLKVGAPVGRISRPPLVFKPELL